MDARLINPFQVLRIALGLTATLAGLDKFFNILANWGGYVSPFAASMLPFPVATLMMVVGVVEIAVGVTILLAAPRIGAYIASGWLLLVAVNLAIGGFFDIAVRDVAAAPAFDTQVKPFGRDTLAAIERQHARTPFWLVLWDLECPYCMKSLSHLAAAQRTDPKLKVVTVSTDSMQSADEIAARLAQLGVRSDAYAFGDAPREALQYTIDATWLGEKPRAYQYRADG